MKHKLRQLEERHKHYEAWLRQKIIWEKAGLEMPQEIEHQMPEDLKVNQQHKETEKCYQKNKYQWKSRHFII